MSSHDGTRSVVLVTLVNMVVVDVFVNVVVVVGAVVGVVGAVQRQHRSSSILSYTW